MCEALWDVIFSVFVCPPRVILSLAHVCGAGHELFCFFRVWFLTGALFCRSLRSLWPPPLLIGGASRVFAGHESREHSEKGGIVLVDRSINLGCAGCRKRYLFRAVGHEGGEGRQVRIPHSAGVPETVGSFERR